MAKPVDNDYQQFARSPRKANYGNIATAHIVISVMLPATALRLKIRYRIKRFVLSAGFSA